MTKQSCRQRLREYALCVFLLMLSGLSPALMAEQAKVIKWIELMPEDWNPNSVFDQYSDEEFAALSDEEFFELQEQAKAMLEAAPTVDALDGKTVKIPGFVLPLEFENTSISEFLLVPYFGACVHTPPPPANQIIHGKLDQQFNLQELFEPVWITGKLRTARSSTELGETGVSLTQQIESGYAMDVEFVEPYEVEN